MKKGGEDTSLDPNCTFSTRQIEFEPYNHQPWVMDSH